MDSPQDTPETKIEEKPKEIGKSKFAKSNSLSPTNAQNVDINQQPNQTDLSNFLKQMNPEQIQ